MSRGRRGFPERLSDVLAPALERIGPKGLWVESTVRRVWPTVVGEQVAANVEIVRLRGSTLVVATSSDAWATEFRYLSASVVEAIGERLGPSVVSEIVVHRGRKRGAEHQR